MRPRALRVQNHFSTDHGLSRMGPCREAVYVDQDVPRQSRQFQREEYQPYRRWRFGDGFRWPTRWSKGEHAVRTGQWLPKPNSYQRLDSSDASLGVQPRVGARTIRSVAVPPSTLPASSVSAAARSVIHPGVVADVPALRRGKRVLGGSVEHGYANESNRSVIARSDARTDVFNHESNRCVVQSITEHPCELQQEVKIPKLATMIRERGAWPRHRPLAVFWAPAGAKDRSHEFCASSRDTLLGGIIAQIKLDDGSHLNGVDDSDLTDFICHHASSSQKKRALLNWNQKRRTTRGPQLRATRVHILRSQGWWQHCRGLSVSTTRSMRTFSRSNQPMAQRSVSAKKVCWGTLYQLCIPVPDKTATTVARCITERWIQYFGPPLVVIGDQGKEFVGTRFKEVTNANSILFSRQYTHKHCTYNAVQSLHKRGMHRTRLAQELHNIFVRLKRVCHLVRTSLTPLLLSHLPFTTSTSSSSFTLHSTTTPEHAAQSGQHDLLQEHPVHHQPVQDLPVDKRRHQEPLWRENLQSGGNPRKTFSTGYEPKELATVSRISRITDP